MWCTATAAIAPATGSRFGISPANDAVTYAMLRLNINRAPLVQTTAGAQAKARNACVIFRFNDDGFIVHEEQYYDM